MAMKNYTIQATWTVQAFIKVRARSLSEAIQISADIDTEKWSTEYVDDTFKFDKDAIKGIYEGLGQEYKDALKEM